MPTAERIKHVNETAFSIFPEDPYLRICHYAREATLDAVENPNLSPRTISPFIVGHAGYGKTSRIRAYARAMRLMHRLIMNVESTVHIDHIDGDGLNNRRENMRPCTRSQNLANQRKRSSKSKYRGLTWSARLNKWVCKLGYQGEKVYLGVFLDEVEAAQAYDKKALELFGEFARLNFPDEVKP